MTVPLPPLPPQSAITVRSEPDCLILSWLSNPKEELQLYRDRFIYTGSLHPCDWMPFGIVLSVTSGAAHPVWDAMLDGPVSFPRHTLGDVRLERNEQTVRLTVQYRLSPVEVGASLGEADKAWLADVLRRWIAG